jgi:hypothetical protein
LVLKDTAVYVSPAERCCFPEDTGAVPGMLDVLISRSRGEPYHPAGAEINLKQKKESFWKILLW